MSSVIVPVRVPVAPPGFAGGMGRRSRHGARVDRHGANSGDDGIDRLLPESAVDTLMTRRERMIAVFGHDLRSLLNALSVNADVFLRAQGESAVRSAQNVRRAISRMDQLVTSLLDYVRLESGKLAVATRPLDAAGLLREAVEIFQPLARSKSLSLTLAIPDGPLRATADPDRLFQVLSNLLSNAIKFSPTKGEIVVQAMTLGSDLQVAVHDEGPGIPEGHLDRVFECFVQLEGGDRRGLGLGLYICRAIIHAHRGKIWATSWPGAGSTFYFTVPGLDSEPS